MRAKIVGMVVLMGFAALSASFAPAKQIAVQETLPRLLTEEEADCLVGGKASCLDVAVSAADNCLAEAGVSFEDLDDLYGAVMVGWCTGTGIWEGASCAWDWFTNLF